MPKLLFFFVKTLAWVTILTGSPVAIAMDASGPQPKANLSPFAQRVWDLFLDPDVHFQESPEALVEYEVVPLKTQIATVNELENIPGVGDLRVLGRSLRLKVVDAVFTEFMRTHSDIGLTFQEQTEKWLKGLTNETALKTYEARNRAAQKMGLRIEDLYRPENTNERWEWERSTQRELFRMTQDHAKALPPRALARWKIEQSQSIIRRIEKEAYPLVYRDSVLEGRVLTENLGLASWQMGYGPALTPEDLGETGELRFSFQPFQIEDSSEENIEADDQEPESQDAEDLDTEADDFEDYEDLLMAQWYIQRPDGTADLIHDQIRIAMENFLYIPTGLSLTEQDALSFLSLNDVGLGIEDTLIQNRLQQYGMLLNMINQLDEDLSRDEFEQWLIAVPFVLRQIQVGVPKVLELLNDKDATSPLWELMGDLRWAGYQRHPSNSWESRQILAEGHDLPLWTLRSEYIRTKDKKAPATKIFDPAKHAAPATTSQRSPREATDKKPSVPLQPPLPPPVPIDNFETTSVYSQDVGYTRLFFFKTPSATEDWRAISPAERAILSPSESPATRLHSLTPRTSTGKWLPLPTPPGEKIGYLQLRTNTADLTPDDYEIWRDHLSGAYAVFFKRKRNVEVTVEFLPDRPPQVLPSFDPQKILPLVHELKLLGEKSLAASWEKTPPENLSELSESIRALSLYSFFPEKAGLKSPGVFGDLKPFLDEDGRLCIQCSHAADHLLLRSAQKIYQDSNELQFRRETTMLAHGRNLIEPLHAAVGVYKNGDWQQLLNPSPITRDPRAPTASFIAQREWREKIKLLESKHSEIVNAAASLAPKNLPKDSPFVQLNKKLRELFETAVFKEDAATTSEKFTGTLAELDRMSAWSEVNAEVLTTDDKKLIRFHGQQLPVYEALAIEVLRTTCESALKDTGR